jgi:AraC-like DNA-binding protein
MRKATLLKPHQTRASRDASVLKHLEKERREWLAKLDPASHFHTLFDHLPGVYFFAKDRRGRTMFASRGILERYKMKSECEMLGLTDHDINPEAMAQGYIQDDAQLLSGKAKSISRLELWFDSQGAPDWFFVTKLPLLDLRGKPQGTMGVLRQATDHEKKLPVCQSLARAVEIMRKDYAQPLTISTISKACFVSERQLQRQFMTAMGITPQEFLIKTRVMTASRLLIETRLSQKEIAQACGFTDASSFALHFRKRTLQTPSAYRQSRVNTFR